MFNNFAKFELPAVKADELWPKEIQAPIFVKASLQYQPNEFATPHADQFTNYFHEIVDNYSPQILNFLSAQRRNYQLGVVDFASTIRQAGPLTLHYMNNQGLHESLGLQGSISPERYEQMQQVSVQRQVTPRYNTPGLEYVRSSQLTTLNKTTVTGKRLGIRVITCNVNSITDDNYAVSINGKHVMNMIFAPMGERTTYVIEAGNLRNAPPANDGSYVIADTVTYDTIAASPFIFDAENVMFFALLQTNNYGNYFEISTKVYEPNGEVVYEEMQVFYNTIYIDLKGLKDGEQTGFSWPSQQWVMDPPEPSQVGVFFDPVDYAVRHNNANTDFPDPADLFDSTEM